MTVVLTLTTDTLEQTENASLVGHLHGLNGLLGAAALSPVRREFRRDDENARDRENVLRRLSIERFRNSR